MADVTVTNNPAENRYEAHIDGKLAGIAEYRRGEEEIVFPHTLVLPEHEGKGVASALAKESLDAARADGLKVVPQCSFYATYIERHRDEYGDLVAR